MILSAFEVCMLFLGCGVFDLNGDQKMAEPACPWPPTRERMIYVIAVRSWEIAELVMGLKE